MSELQPIHRETDIIQWAEDRHIFDRATALSQAGKLIEEACELFIAIAMQDRDGIRDGIGDLGVCCDIQASFAGMSQAECREHAWGEIKDRKGELRNGVFVKEADLATAPPHTEMPSDEKHDALDAVGLLTRAVRLAVGRAAESALRNHIPDAGKMVQKEAT